jgi:hypothetical protein
MGSTGEFQIGVKAREVFLFHDLKVVANKIGTGINPVPTCNHNTGGDESRPYVRS